jgi:hypothetical protein
MSISKDGAGAMLRGVCGLGAVLWALTSCGNRSDRTVLGDGAEARLGKLEVPLDTTGSSGASYRLSASLLLTGPEEQTLLLSGAVPAVEVELAPGTYQASLNEPWRLSRVDASGPRAVDAVLVSENPATVQIEPDVTTQLELRFRVEGGEVVPAPDGALSVVVAVDDSPPTGSVCDGAGAAPCLEERLDEALLASGDASGCLPAQTSSTPLGNVQICGDGVVCADGSPGCPIAGLELEAATEAPASGPTQIAISAALRNPLAVPVRLPPLFGGGLCRLAVNAAFPEVRTSLNRSDAGDGQVALQMGPVSAGPANIDVSLLQGGALCETLVPLAEDLIARELQALAGELILSRLPELVASLRCTECSAGCALRCPPSP